MDYTFDIEDFSREGSKKIYSTLEKLLEQLQKNKTMSEENKEAALKKIMDFYASYEVQKNEAIKEVYFFGGNGRN